MDLFLTVDLINSLWRLEDPERIKERTEDLLKEYKKEWPLYPKDHPKTHVTLALPERKHLEAVKGNWTRWVWKQIAYDGSEMPSFEGWVRDLAAIADALKGEGVRVTFMAGKSGKILEEMGLEEAIRQ